MTYDPNKPDLHGADRSAWGWLVAIVFIAVLIILAGSMVTNKRPQTASYNSGPAISGTTGSGASTHTGGTGAPGGGGSGSPATGGGTPSR